MPLIRVAENMFTLLEKRLKYRFWDANRQLSNKNQAKHELGMALPRGRAICPQKHDDIGWVGPPYDKVRAYVCLRCNAWASEPEIKDRGFTFDEVPDWEIHAIMDLDLQRQAQGNPKSFYTGGG